MSVEEMEVLLATKEIEINGEKVIVKPFSFLDTLKITVKATGLVNSALKDADGLSSAIRKITVNDATEGIEDITGVRLVGIVELAGIIGEDGIEFIIDLIKMSTGLDKKQLDLVDPLKGIDMVEMIYQVNKDFFTKCMNRLFPKTKKITKKTKKVKAE